MESKSISEYIFLGFNWGLLRTAKEGWPVHKEAMVMSCMKWFFKGLSDFNFTVTKRATYELESLQQKLQKTPPEHKLTSVEAAELRKIMNDLGKTLEAEARGKIAFITTDKRFPVDKLLESISSLMAQGVFVSLPEIAQYDFKQAGKCIAFSLPTSAAFHLMRGTEAVLRLLYCSVVKQKRVSPLNWGPMVKDLRRKRKKPPDTVLDHLDNIRENFRNPTQHPEMIYDMEEAQDLFNLSVEAVNRMMRFIGTKKTLNLIKEHPLRE